MRDTNTLDYLLWRGDLTFAQSPFNDIDGLILSVLSYLHFRGSEEKEPLTITEALTRMEAMPDEEKYDGPIGVMEPMLELAKTAAMTERFRDMRVCRFTEILDEEQEMQFAAVIFLVPDGTAYVSFRGTDNTLIGWKEDFNMFFSHGVPAQMAAARYLEDFLQSYYYPVRVGGHSKGGNLSVWAAVHQTPENQKKIIDIYNMDGPGFYDEFFEREEYLRIRDRIHSYVPRNSIIGVLLNHDDYVTIESSVSNAIDQHNTFTWIVEGTHLVSDKERTRRGRQFEKVMNHWLRSMSAEEREEFVDLAYEIVTSTDATTLQEFDHRKFRNLLRMQRTFRELGREKQQQLLASLGKIVFNSDNLLEGLKERSAIRRIYDEISEKRNGEADSSET